MSLLVAEGLTRIYHRGRRRGGAGVLAVDDVSLTLEAGSVTGLVGASGSGKSTLARCLALLERPDAGSLALEGDDVSALRGEALRKARRKVQLLFQDPAAALNPRFDVAAAIAEPLLVAAAPKETGATESARDRAASLLAEVELDAEMIDRSVGALSGGQRQRVTLARALAVEPRLLILDEGFSRLDWELRARMAELLLRLGALHGLALLVISHDVRFVAETAPRILVMHDGRLVEDAAPAELLANPEHPQSRELVAALQSLRA